VTVLGASRRSRSQVPLALAGATVLVQISYPLTGGGLRDTLTVLTVLLFAAASLTAARLRNGTAYAAVLLAVTAVGGFAAEAIGVATGLPFGDYAYAGSLGPRLLGVPLVIPLAWTMMAYPARVVGQVCARGRVGRIGVSALALASWDVFLDPQMTDAGHWRFAAHDGPTLTGIPLVNFAGWLLVAVLLMTALELLLPEHGRRPSLVSDPVPLGLYLWTYASSLLANLAFFGRPDVALAGGLAMGVPVALLVLGLRGAPAARR
jgi:carotene biosynthesis associated membrane protein